MAEDTSMDAGPMGANPFGDLTKTLEQFKVPGADMSSFIDARRKDVEALVEINKAAYGAMQALARTQTDMLAQSMQGIQESAKGLTSGTAGGLDAANQSEVARNAWQKMLADMKTLAEMAKKAQADAVASLTARTKENMEEVQKVFLPK